MESPEVPASHPLRGLLTIFFSPAETFDAAGRRPWLVPLIATAILALAMNVMIISVMGMGTIVRNQMESNPKIAERLGPDKVNQMVQEAENSTGRKIGTYAGAFFGAPIVVMIIAGLTYGGLLATGASTRFPAVLGATAWATYCVLVVTAVGSAIFLAAVHDYSGVDPQHMLMLDASIFFDKQTTVGWVRALASGIDLVAFWSLYIKCVGLTRLSERVSMGQAVAVSGALYVLWILGKTGFAAMFG